MTFSLIPKFESELEVGTSGILAGVPRPQLQATATHSAYNPSIMAEDGEFERPSHGGHSTAINPDQIGGNTRFYEKEFPDLEECVVVNVKAIAGAFVGRRLRLA